MSVKRTSFTCFLPCSNIEQHWNLFDWFIGDKNKYRCHRWEKCICYSLQERKIKHLLIRLTIYQPLGLIFVYKVNESSCDRFRNKKSMLLVESVLPKTEYHNSFRCNKTNQQDCVIFERLLPFLDYSVVIIGWLSLFLRVEDA